MARLRYNGLSATLGAALTSSDTTITFAAALTSAAGAVPTITGSDTIALSIFNASGAVSEVVSLTAYTSGATTGTITRAQEGTTAAAHAAGDKVIHGPTVDDFWTVAGASIATTETTSATTATDLATVGPVATVKIGSSGRALVTMGALMWNSTVETYSNLWFAVSGATTMAASGSYVVSGRNGSTSGGPYYSGTYLVTGLNPGVNTFTLKYSASAGTSSFARRSITVIGL